MSVMYSSSLKPFVLNPNDLAFILKQVNFRPLFDADGNAIVNWDGTGAIYDGHGNLIWDGTGMDAASAMAAYGTSYNALTSFAGLRDVQGLNNNLNLDRSSWGAVDNPFLRTVQSQYAMDSHGHVYIAGESGYETGTDINGNPLFSGDAFYANQAFGNGFGGTTGFGSTGFAPGVSQNYEIVDDGNGNAVMDNIIDYTPRMISLLTTTGGVVFDRDGNGNIIYTDGIPNVVDWGLLGDLGIQDTQARFAGTPGEGDVFIGAQNPGVSPTNGWFTAFGQFFDHGLDFIDKGAQGKTIKIAFAESDPLYGLTGPDGRPATGITISRANVAGFDANGNPEYLNHTSPFIDQSQSYGSHADVTLLLREWVLDPVTGTYQAGMNLLNGNTLATSWQKPDGEWTNETLPTLNELRAHVVATGRDDLTWEDVFNYHNSGQALVLDMNPHFDEANLISSSGFNDTDHNGVLNVGEKTQAEVVQDAVAWLGNVANGAIRDESAPGAGDGDSFGFVAGELTLVLGTDLVAGPQTIPAGTYTGANAMMLWVNFANMSVMSTSAIGVSTSGDTAANVGQILLASIGDHYIAGDGRVNENFGLTTVHHVFHEEHNFQVDNLINAIRKEADAKVGTIGDGTYDSEYMKEFQVWDDADAVWNPATGNYEIGGVIAWDLDKMFQATKLVVEMEYQHVAIDQYARFVTPDIKEFVGYTAGENPTVSLEYAQSIFRFGHSQLRETIDTIDPDHGLTGKITGYALKLAFLNPDQYADLGPAAIALGLTHQQGNEIDEFITPALNQGLLGLPLDLAAINIARGRDVGIPGLNEFRVAVGLRAYEGWADFGANMIHPDNLVNFIAAYSFDGDVTKAEALMALYNADYSNVSAADAATTLGLSGTQNDWEDYAYNFMNGGDKGVDAIDTWLGGLAEVHVTGGLLGETFNLVFVDQMERIQDGDRFYYLYRTVNQQFGDEIAGNQFKDIIERNTGLTHLGGSAFSYSDQYYDLGATVDAANTVNNEHKYGALVDVVGNTKGVFSDGGTSESRNGSVITVRITDPFTGAVTTKQFFRDTRAEDPNAPNGGLGIDGTPNSGAESTEVIVGTQFDDVIHARGGDDTVYGEGGNDIIYGEIGIDRLYGGDGKDYIYGGDGGELMDGGSGDDFMWGDSSATAAAGLDQLIGGMGNDYISGGVGIDKLAGGAGDDVIYGDGDTDPFTHGGDGNDYIDGGISGDNLYGDNGDDVIVGAADQDILYGGNGDDILRPGEPSQALGGGPDEVLGGDGVTDNGFDIIDFSDLRASAVGIDFDLSNQANPQVQIDGTTPVPAATQMEGIVGSRNNDTLTGDNDLESGKDSWLIGATGDDKFVGGLGNDVIVGGSVRLDTMIGKYNTAYNHNNNNDNANATGIVDVDENGNARTYTQEQMDYLYQGASHRVAWSDQLDSSGILDAANAQLGGVDYAKHFTEMLRTERFKDMMLGDGGSDAGRTDTLILAGARADYAAAEVDYAGHKVVRLTGINGSAAEGSDLVIDVENFQFADQTMSFAQVVARPALTVGDVQMAEGNVDSAPAMVRISLAYAVGIDVTVTYSTANGTASNPMDFEGVLDMVVIPAGQTFVDVPVYVIGDTLYEADETFTFTVNSASYGIVAGDSGVVTITNDDAAPAMTVGDVTLDEGGNATITVTLDTAAGKDIVINYAAVDGTAVSPDDYVLANGSLTILAGDTTATLVVSAINDTLFEGIESYSVNFTSADTSNTSAASAVIQIDPADLMPTVSISDPVAVTEGGAPAMVFTVSLSGPSGLPVTVDFATADGTATAGQDYTAQTGSVTFAPGELTKSISVPVIDDTIYETPTEAFTVTLSNAAGAVLTTAAATGTVNDNDLPPVISVTGASITEGNAGTKLLNFTVTMTGNTSQTATVDFITADGTATVANNDYVAQSGSLTFLPGGTPQTVSVVINGDLQLEGNETVLLSLTNPVNATIGALGAGTITNDDIFNLVNGTIGPDLLLGTANRDNMTGLAGNDVLRSSAGADILDGGADIDTADYSNATGGVMVNLGATSGANGTSNTARETAATTGTVTSATAVVSTDALVSIENIIGSAYGDRLAGSTGDNVFTPGAGADIVLGQGGIDTVDYSNAVGGVRANLASNYVRETALTAGTVSAATATITQDSLTGIRNATGSAYGDLIEGNANANVLDGGAGADTINGAGGNDTITGGDGDDLVIQSSTQGRDFVDGGIGSDTYQLNGDASAETFTIYTRAAALAANAALVLNANTEIVIVRNGTAVTGTVIAELDNIEEISVNTLAVSSGGVNGGANSGDTITVVGDFTQTSLNYNTITINGGQGNDVVDIAGLTSAHRIVFTTAGGQDTVIGQLRPQDVVVGALASDVQAVQPAVPPFASFLTQDWLVLSDNSGLDGNGIGLRHTVDVQNPALDGALMTDFRYQAMPVAMSTELYEELAPLAGATLGQSAMHVSEAHHSISTGMFISVDKFDVPVRWLSEQDDFNDFRVDFNGHFIP